MISADMEYGISSIQKVADKYGGDVIIETQDGKFVLTVMMNIGILTVRYVN